MGIFWGDVEGDCGVADRCRQRRIPTIDFIGNAQTDLLDQSDAIHPTGFLIMTNIYRNIALMIALSLSYRKEIQAINPVLARLPSGLGDFYQRIDFIGNAPAGF